MRTCSTPIASPSCSAAKRPRARRLKAPRGVRRGDWAGAAARRKARGARRASQEEGPFRNAEGSFLIPASTAAVSRKCSRLTPRRPPRFRGNALARTVEKPWRRPDFLSAPSLLGRQWALAAFCRWHERKARARRAGAVRLLDRLHGSANGAEAFPQMTGDACHGPSSRVPCACGCLLRGCLHVAGGLSGRQWKGIGGLMFLAGCPDSRGLVRCDLLLARAERRRRCP